MSGPTADTLGDTDWLSEYLGVPKPALTTWRSRGTGPPYVKVGRLVRYRASDVEAWLQEQAACAGSNRSAS